MNVSGCDMYAYHKVVLAANRMRFVSEYLYAPPCGKLRTPDQLWKPFSLPSPVFWNHLRHPPQMVSSRGLPDPG